MDVWTSPPRYKIVTKGRHPKKLLLIFKHFPPKGGRGAEPESKSCGVLCSLISGLSLDIIWGEEGDRTYFKSLRVVVW